MQRKIRLRFLRIPCRRIEECWLLVCYKIKVLNTRTTTSTLKKWFFLIIHPMLLLTSSTNTMLRHTTMTSTLSVRPCTHLSLSHPHSPLVIGRDLEYFSQAGFDMDRIQIKRNAPVALLYEDAIRNEGAIISSSGALINFSGKKTGRSPKDKRIVYEETSKDDIWWGSVNIKMDERMIRSHQSFFVHLFPLQTLLKSIESVPSII
jgi:Phosphoenolpyruvate carboxykinase